MSEAQEPQGIGFFNIKSGDTNYAKSQAQIQGYLNSSDMGINASRGQDMGWRLEPGWVKKVKAFRGNENKMSILVAKNGGKSPTTPQILYAIYGAELRQARQVREEQSTPFEEEYLRSISNAKTETAETKPTTNKK